MDDASAGVTGSGRRPTVAVSALAAVVAVGSVAGNLPLMQTAVTSWCGTCAEAARTDLLAVGLALAVLWPAAWAGCRAVAPAARRAVAVCGAGSLAGWAVSAAVAFGWLQHG